MNNLILILHTHMPYVRKNGIWPVGEDWLYQAIAHCYIPLIECLHRVRDRGLSRALTLTLTPPLIEQLCDPYIREGFESFSSNRELLAEEDRSFFESQGSRTMEAQALDYREYYRKILERFSEWDGELTRVFAELQGAGLVELWGSAASHAYLPLLPDTDLVGTQISLGLATHELHLGGRPKGFWLPECGYRNGVEGILSEQGIRYTSLDPQIFAEDSVGGARRLGESDTGVFVRSLAAQFNVWDDVHGYPTRDAFRDTTKYRSESGLFYWRVTGKGVPIEKKGVYRREDARDEVVSTAEHFISEIIKECEGQRMEHPLVVASFDTELFGHGWHEGIDWLEAVMTRADRNPDLELTTPSAYIESFGELRPAEVREGSWEFGGGHTNWLTGDTGVMWEGISAANGDWRQMRESLDVGREGPVRRALRQAARELLLMQSSDWTFMVARNRAKKYATLRFESHKERYYRLMEILRTGRTEPVDTAEIDSIEELDRLFTEIDPLSFM